MITRRQLRSFWIAFVTTLVLTCFSDAAAQASYQVTDLGSLRNGNAGCAMAVNNQGWTEIVDGPEIQFARESQSAFAEIETRPIRAIKASFPWACA